MSLNDLDLIDEIRSGSQAAFDQLIRRHQHFVYRVAYSYAGESDGALDKSQNVFIKVHHKLNSFCCASENVSTFLPWQTLLPGVLSITERTSVSVHCSFLMLLS